MIDRSEALRILKDAFPSLRGEIGTSYGQLHVEFGCFERHAQRCIDENDRAELARCFAIAAQLATEGSLAIRNAVAVSFLEGLNFADGRSQRSWALDLLPPTLRSMRTDLIKHADALARKRTK